MSCVLLGFNTSKMNTSTSPLTASLLQGFCMMLHCDFSPQIVFRESENKINTYLNLFLGKCNAMFPFLISNLEILRFNEN